MGEMQRRKPAGTAGHGGRRAGAGRPRLTDQRMVSRTVTLPEDLVERLTALGDGNLSAGIRRMAETAM